jgi:hypothetical protein
MNDKLKKILSLLKLSKEEVSAEEVVTLSEMVLDNGTILTADEFTEGNSVFIKALTEEDSNLPLPIGEYTLEDGKILVVEVEGEILSITEPESPEPEEPKKEEVVEAAEEELPKEDEVVEEVVEELEDEMTVEGLAIQVAELQARLLILEELLAKETPVEELKVVKEVIELSEEVVEEVVEEVKFSPETKTKSKGQIYFPKNPMNTTRDKVFSRISNSNN